MGGHAPVPPPLGYTTESEIAVKLTDVLVKHSDDEIALVCSVCFQGQQSIVMFRSKLIS